MSYSLTLKIQEWNADQTLIEDAGLPVLSGFKNTDFNFDKSK